MTAKNNKPFKNSKSPNRSHKYDVIIVGGGPAGIFAALELYQVAANIKILLLEKGKDIDTIFENVEMRDADNPEQLKRTKQEKEAKKIDGKNAFAIAVLKRSGEIRKAAFKWEYDGESTIQIMEELVQSLKQDEFSDTFIKNLSAEFGRFMTDGLLHEFKPLIETEMRRLIERSCMMRKKENESREEFENRKKDRINELNRKLKHIYSNSRSFEDFISFLDIAVFIEREVKKCE